MQKIIFFILNIFISISLFSQEFSKEKIIEINQLTGENFYDVSDVLESKTKFIIPLNPAFENEENFIKFIIIDSNYNVSFAKWKHLSLIPGYLFYCDAGLVYPNNRIIIMSDEKLFLVKQKGDKFVNIAKKKFPTGKNNEYERIDFMNYPAYDHILLSSTYNSWNCIDENSLYSKIRLAKFNFKKGKIEKKVELDVGKGIFLGMFSFDWIATSNNAIAVANPTKPEIYLYDNNLDIKDTIFIDYPDIIKTGKFIDSIISDDIIKKYKYKMKELGDFLLASADIYKLPKIKKIVFINDDLLLICVQPKCNSGEENCGAKTLFYVYSLSNEEFYDNNGVLSNFSAFNSTANTVFINNQAINITDSVDDSDKIRYSANYNQVKVDLLDKYVQIIDTTVLLSANKNLQYYNMNNFAQNFSDFDYIYISDLLACSHCRYLDKFKKILVVHCFSKNDKNDKTSRFFYKKQYELMFKNPTVVFTNYSDINENIEKNSFYKIKVF
jgi:hypothetical protein